MDTERKRKRRRRSILIACIVFPVSTAGAYLLQMMAHGDPSERARQISAAHGIAVAFGDPAGFRLSTDRSIHIIPEDMRAESTDQRHVSAALEGIDAALNKYPAGFVPKLVSDVFICGVLHAANARAAGTLGDGWILIAAPADRDVDDVERMAAATVHHELSSVVLKKTGALERWREYWPRGRAQEYGYDDVVRTGEGDDPVPATGFVSAYGMTNPENDFNMYAEKLFTDSGALSRLADRYPLVRTKLQFVIDRYVEIDPRIRQSLIAENSMGPSAVTNR
jgi:hypothetical protein